jgi:hypothetical protein
LLTLSVSILGVLTIFMIGGQQRAWLSLEAKPCTSDFCIYNVNNLKKPYWKYSGLSKLNLSALFHKR